MGSKRVEPIFTRGEVAEILNVTPLTIANREKSGKYPQPKRDLNDYRVYTLNDVLNLQLATYKTIDTRVIVSKMWDKGYKDYKLIGQILDAALNRRKGVTS